MKELPSLGVVVVTFNSAGVIAECLESLFASDGVALHVVVVDNASSDRTRTVIRDWAKGEVQVNRLRNSPLGEEPSVAKPIHFTVRTPDEAGKTAAGLSLIESPINGGFAYGVNLGLRALLEVSEIDAFWILNPDCVVGSDVASLYLKEAARGGYALLGCRTVFYEKPDLIQTDGGRVSPWTATCISVNGKLPGHDRPLPDAASLNYISGANMVASRAFIELAGLMVEDYFLYYEEVDWAFRRGHLPLRLVPDAVVYHHGGTVIGTGSWQRRPSSFANYFNYRNRVHFARRHMPLALPLVLAKAIAKSVQLLFLGAQDEARSIVTGTFGRAPPPDVADRITGTVERRLAFGDGK